MRTSGAKLLLMLFVMLLATYYNELLCSQMGPVQLFRLEAIRPAHAGTGSWEPRRSSKAICYR